MEKGKANSVTFVGKRYLGDGAYVAFDGYSLVLTTENGIEVTNTIVLEPDVYGALLIYVEHLKAIAAQGSAVLPSGVPEPECDCSGGDQGDGLVALPHEPTCPRYQR